VLRRVFEECDNAEGDHGDHGCVTSDEEQEGDGCYVFFGEVAWDELGGDKERNQVVLRRFEAEGYEVANVGYQGGIRGACFGCCC